MAVGKLSEAGFVGFMGLSELSECTSHLVEYAANRGLSRITDDADYRRGNGGWGSGVV